MFFKILRSKVQGFGLRLKSFGLRVWGSFWGVGPGRFDLHASPAYAEGRVF